MKLPPPARIREHALRLVAQPSVTGTEGERRFPDLLRGMIEGLPRHPRARLVIEEAGIGGFPPGRRNLAALVRGRGPGTVVLAGHYDTVGIEDYGALAPWATEPEALAGRLVASLEAAAGERQAIADIASGRFLPGRGLLDMKAGLAAGLGVLEAVLGAEDPAGNVILLACPDEENQSAGMRAAGDLLHRIAAREGLDLRLMINLDALQDPGDGARGRMVGLGCIGKHLVTALVIGVGAHACYPFNGVSAAYLAAALVAALEGSPALAERSGGEAAAPPAVLLARDLKPGYDVTTPARAWCGFNVIVQRRSAEETLRLVAAEVHRALDDALARLAERAAAAGARFASRPVAVLDYRTLAARAAAAPGFGRARAARLAEIRKRHAAPMPEAARALTELAWDHAGLPAPAVVLGFGGLSYPHVPPLRVQGGPALEAAVRAAVQAVAQRHGTEIGFCDHLPIVSDMSFPGLGDPTDYAQATANNPLWGADLIDWDFRAYPRLPVINAGPWGRDYHHPLERVEANYAFAVLPDVLLAICRAVVAADE